MATAQSQDDWAKTALRLPREIHTQVHEMARKEDRSFNGQLVALIRDGLKERQRVEARRTGFDMEAAIAQRERTDEAARQSFLRQHQGAAA